MDTAQTAIDAAHAAQEQTEIVARALYDATIADAREAFILARNALYDTMDLARASTIYDATILDAQEAFILTKNAFYDAFDVAMVIYHTTMAPFHTAYEIAHTAYIATVHEMPPNPPPDIPTARMHHH